MADRYAAIVFDLLSALLDSWTLWGRVAGDERLGARWRRTCLEMIYAAGRYRPYEEVVADAARAVELDPAAAEAMLARWDELEPWPEAPAVLRDLAADHDIALVTNCSEALARRAAARLGVPADVLVSAEAAGFYKPRPEPYRRALDELGVAPRDALFVAGSAGDVPGAAAVGMPVVWHNRARLPAADGPEPLAELETLSALPDIARAG
jgi:2-haloalkanoic acid dehalogenase type II